MLKDSLKCPCCGEDLAAESHDRAQALPGVDAGADALPQPHERTHPAVRVTVRERSEDIDAGIAPLIRALWECDIDTVMSCERDGFGYVWVEFLTVHDLTRFLNVVGRYEPGKDALFNRMLHHWQTTDLSREWVYEIHPTDYAFNLDVVDPDDPDAHDGECEFEFYASVRFPHEDLPVVTYRFLEHAALTGRT